MSTGSDLSLSTESEAGSGRETDADEMHRPISTETQLNKHDVHSRYVTDTAFYVDEMYIYLRFINTSTLTFQGKINLGDLVC